MSDLLMNTIDTLLNEAETSLHDVSSILDNLLQTSANNEDSSEEETMLAIQLTLQYRLACEDALSFLLRMDHNLLYFLGVQPQHSAQMNLERLAYAVGNDDLKQILNVLAILTGSLSKIIARYKKNHASFTLKDNKPPKQHMITKALALLLAKKNQFLNTLQKLDLEIKQLLKRQPVGPILDHIAALRGPISQFHQALIHHLGQAKQLYHQINKNTLINQNLNELIKKTEHVLHSMPGLYNQPSKPLIKQFDHPTTSEQLEQRATAKRLRSFWS